MTNPWGDSPVVAGTAPAEEDDGGFWGKALDAVVGGISNVTGIPTPLVNNAVTEFGGMAKGVWTLGASAIHDVGMAATWATHKATGNDEAADKVNFIGDDLWQAVTGTGAFSDQGSVIINDYQERYGGGGRSGFGGWLMNTAEETYEHPLSFIGDVLTVATAGGYGAAKGASLAQKVGLASKVDDVATVGKAAEAATAVTEAQVAAARAAGAADPVAAAKAAADAASNLGAAGSAVNRADRIVRAIQGTARQTIDPISGKVVTKGQAINPVRRVLYQNRFENAVSGDTAWARATAQKLAAKADDLGENAPAAMKYMQDAQRLRVAAERAQELGINRVYRPSYSRMVAKKAVDHLVGSATGRSAAVSGRVIDSYDTHLGSLDQGLYPQETVFDTMVGTDTVHTADHVVAREGHGVRDSEVFDATAPAEVGIPARWGGGDPVSDPYSVKDTTGISLDSSGKNTDVPLIEVKGPSGEYVSLRRTADGKGFYPYFSSTPETLQGRGLAQAVYKRAAAEARARGGRLLSGELNGDSRRVWEALERKGEARKVLEGDGIGQYEYTGGGYDVTGYPSRVPAPDAAERPEFDAALKQAQKDTEEIIPALRTELGDEASVRFAPVKGEESIRRSAALVNGTWRDVDDIVRARIIHPDAYTPDMADSLVARIEKATGATLKRTQRSVDSPDATGARMTRFVFERGTGKAARPFEVQVVDALGARIIDGTTNTRQMMNALAVKAKMGLATPDDLLRIEALKRESQALWAAVTDNIRTARGGEKAADLRAAINQFRIDAYAETTDPFIGRSLDPLSAFRNKYKNLQLQNGGVYDPKAKEVVNAPDAFTLDDIRAREGEMRPMYTPMMDESQLGPRVSALSRGATQGRPSSALNDPNFKRNTGQLIATQRASKNVREVWRVRAAQTGRLQQRLDTVFDMVAEHGRPLGKLDEARPGEEIFVPGLVKRLQAQHNALLDSLATDPTGKGVADLLSKLTDENATELQKLLDSSGDLEAFAVPEVVAQRLRDHAPWIQHEGMDIVFGSPTRVWKAFTLAGSPRWMVNNLLGNTIFLKLQGGNLTDVAKQLSPKYRRRLIEAMGEEVESKVGGGSLYKALADEPRHYTGDSVLSRFAGAIERKTFNTRPRRVARSFAEWTQGKNSAMEDAFRRASYLTAAERTAARHQVDLNLKGFWRSKKRLESAFRVGLNEKQWKEAVDEVNKTLNDYASASPIAQNIIKPYVAPFWSFYRHAAKTLFTLPFEHPAKARMLQLLGDADDERLREAGIDPEQMPGWMKGGGLFTGRGEAGEYRFMSTAGMNPFNTVLQSPATLLHPFAKVAYEDATGRSAFTGKQFSDADVVPGKFGSTDRFRVDPDTGQVTPVEKTAPGIVEHLLQQVPQYELVKDVIAGGSTYDTSTLMDALKYRVTGEDSPVVMDSQTGEPFNPLNFVDAMAKLFGYSDFDVSAASLGQQDLQSKAAAMQNWYRAHPGE